MNDIGLYIHIPFCRSRCNYCDFYSRCNLENIDLYVDALCKSINSTNRTFDTVFFGGGTPSVLSPEHWGKIFSSLKGKISVGAEITAETNPCDLTEDYLSFLLHAGINRLSVGIQSLDDDILSYIGRRHNKSTAENAVDTAFSVGFRNISADFMLGLYGQTEKHIKQAVDFAEKHRLTHLSCYMLKIEENTVFYKKSLPCLSDDETAELYLLFVKEAKDAGFMQYEISNFAKIGYESRHNLKYWLCTDYLGLGPGAHSSLDGKRFYTEPDTAGFIKNVNEGNSIFSGYENTEPEKEKAMLGLRLSRGIDISEFSGTFRKKMIEASRKYVSAGLLTTENGIFRLTEKGFLLSNTVISDLVF